MLGIDAAWTSTQPSGVALIVEAARGSWRCVAVAESYAAFVVALTENLGEVPLVVPAANDVKTLGELKAIEDQVDALVCAWVGARFLAGRAEPFGDANAAIWCPRAA